MLLKRVFAAAVAGICLLGGGAWVGGAFAATGEPGTVADPLVTKSYVDEVVATLVSKEYVDQAVAGLADKAYMENRLAQIKTLFEVVRVPKDAKVLGESGTEIVLRGGKATAIVSPMGGVLDATDGVDVFQGESVKPNHLLVIPVSDGRGLTAQTDLILIVKGPYTVKTAGQ